MTAKLHVGYIGKTRAGKRVEIVAEDKDGDFKGCDGYFRYKNGLSYGVGRLENEDDIIGSWEEPAAKVGEWIGWNGGECPVHRKTVVECAYIDDRSSISGLAYTFPWNGATYSNGATDRPAAYRIIKEHKEPREWWIDPVQQNKIVDKSHAGMAGIIHVREVLDEGDAE